MAWVGAHSSHQHVQGRDREAEAMLFTAVHGQKLKENRLRLEIRRLFSTGDSWDGFQVAQGGCAGCILGGFQTPTGQP